MLFELVRLADLRTSGLAPQWMVAELQLTDPLLELTISGVLDFGFFRSESYIFKSS